MTARARTGNRLLHLEAKEAALATIFNKPAIIGVGDRFFRLTVSVKAKIKNHRRILRKIK